jgi:predicted nuclease with TOPRIM domain
MLTQTDLDEIEKIVEEKVEEKIGEKTNLLPTKEEFFGKMDEVMGELKAIREEHAVQLAKVSEHSDQLEDHEVRISNLEVKISPL